MKEIWKDIQGYEGLYQVSNFGRVKSLDRKLKNRWGDFIRSGKVMVTNKSNRYFAINLFTNWQFKHCKIHKLVAAAFVPNPNNKPQINHIDGIKSNNHADNLEWVTQAENMQHAKKMGLRPNFKGEKNPCAKLTDEKVTEIRSKYKEGSTTYRKLGAEYGVSFSVIYNIMRGKNWPHVTLKTA